VLVENTQPAAGGRAQTPKQPQVGKWESEKVGEQLAAGDPVRPSGRRQRLEPSPTDSLEALENCDPSPRLLQTTGDGWTGAKTANDGRHARLV